MVQYVITDGYRYIYRNHQNRFVPSPGEAMADVFNMRQAESILKNSLPKSLRKIFYIEKIDDPPANVKQVSKENLNTTEKLGVADNIQVWRSKIGSLNGLFNEANQRKEHLLKQLSLVDQEISDCLHYIEFCNLNAAQGYNSYKLIKERRVRRRSIKNELEIIECILSRRIGDSILEEVNTVIEKMDKRTYEPRVLTELFDL